MELLNIEGEEKNHFVYIKEYDRLMFHFTKHKEREFLYALFAMFLFKYQFS